MMQDLSPYNTRLFKKAGGEYLLVLASASTSTEPLTATDDVAPLLGSHDFEGTKIVVQLKSLPGDFDAVKTEYPLLAEIDRALESLELPYQNFILTPCGKLILPFC